MVDKPITSKLAELLYDVYEVPYLTCLTVQEYEKKVKALEIIIKKRVNVEDFLRVIEDTEEIYQIEDYNSVADNCLDFEEFEFLKEVFCEICVKELD